MGNLSGAYNGLGLATGGLEMGSTSAPEAIAVGFLATPARLQVDAAAAVSGLVVGTEGASHTLTVAGSPDREGLRLSFQGEVKQVTVQ